MLFLAFLLNFSLYLIYKLYKKPKGLYIIYNLNQIVKNRSAKKQSGILQDIFLWVVFEHAQKYNALKK